MVEELPNGVPGELRVTVSMADGADDLSPTVLAKLEELRPAGIRLLTGPAATVTLAVRVALVLAGGHLAAGEVEAPARRRSGSRSSDAGRPVGVGQQVRTGPLLAAILTDAAHRRRDAPARPEGRRAR